MDIQQLAWRYFSKKNGYVLRPDVIAYLLERIQHSSVPADKVAKLLEYIADNFAGIVGKTVEIVERKTLEEVVEKLFKAKITLTSGANIDLRDFCAVISSSLLGNWKYNERSNTFQKSNSIDGVRQQYFLLRKRLCLLMPGLSLQNINGLKGKECGVSVTCFGMIQEFKEESFYLEDLDDSVRLEIPKSSQIDYVVCKNSYSLVTGSLKENGDLFVQEIRSVPAMNIEDHKRLLPSLDFANIMQRLEKRSEIEAVECNSQHFFFCFINDSWLDYAAIRHKIARLFESLKEHSQVVFIFCGYLFSPLFSGDHSSIIKDLALIIHRTCPKSLFIFSHNSQVPLFPQAPLPSSIFKHLGDHNIRYYVAQNPTRVAYCTQEVVAVDDSLCRQLYRNTLSRMGCLEDLSYNKCKREVYKLLIDQAFLAPMESQVFDPDTFSSMCLYPPPNILFINQTDVNDFFLYAGTICIGQKSFSIENSNSVFLYNPSLREVTVHEF